MLKERNDSNIEIPVEKFTRFNKQIFHDEDIIPDKYTPLSNPANHNITQAELTEILEKHYKATKSRGLSKIPP